MFNNIIDQSDVINLLKNDLANNTLPNSMIFYGNKYSGKLTASLELVRILNCLEKKENNCSCRNCQAVNNLNFTGLIFLSRRNFLKLLIEVINSYKLTGNKNLKYDIIKIIKLISFIYALYIGIGVAFDIHWFSEFIAGAIIGAVIGIVVGKSFKEREPELFN